MTFQNLFLVLFALFSALSVPVPHASVICTLYLSASACYTVDTQCHWNGLCTSGAASTCAQMYTDYPLCAANTQCHVDPSSSLCTNGNSCLVTSVANCLTSTYSYCSINYALSPPVCQSVAVTAGTCATKYSNSACTSASCYWDQYVGACFNNLAQSAALYPCSNWNSYGSNSNPCLSHLCYYSSYAGCTSTYVPTPDTSQQTLGYSRTVQFQNPRVIPNSLTVQVDAYVPLVLDMTRPYTSFMSIGNYGPNFAAQLAANLNCSSVYNKTVNANSQNGAYFATPSVVTFVNNSGSLNTYFINKVNSTHWLNFYTQSAMELGLRQFFGPGLDITAGNWIFTSVYVSSDSSTLIFTMQADLNWLYTNCAGIGVTRGSSTDNSVVYYTIPLTWVDTSKTGTLTYNNFQFQVGVITASVYSFIPNTVAYTSAIQLLSAGSVYSGCAAGTERLTETYALSFSGIYSSNVVLGPLTLADISLSKARECFGDYATNLTQATCSNFVCTSYFTVSSRCFTSQSNGLTYADCNNNLPAAKAQDLVDLTNVTGSAVTSYPQWMQGYHEFNVAIWECDSGLTNPCVTLVGSQNPIVIRTNFSGVAFTPANPYPIVTVVGNLFSFDYSLYPLSLYLAGSPLISQPPFTVTDSQTQSVTFVNSTNANSLTQNYDQYVIAIKFHLNVSYPVYINISSPQFLITPTNRLGQVLQGSGFSPIGYAGFSAMLTILPTLERANSCPACPPVPGCAGLVTGCDGLALVKGGLFALFPTGVEGLLFTVPFYYDPTWTGNVMPHRRRLLQQTQSNSTQSIAEFLLLAAAPPDATLPVGGDDDTSTGSSLGPTVGVTGGILGGIGLTALGVFLYKKKQDDPYAVDASAVKQTNVYKNDTSAPNYMHRGITPTQSLEMTSSRGSVLKSVLKSPMSDSHYRERI